MKRPFSKDSLPVAALKATIFLVPIVIMGWLTAEYLAIFGTLSITYDFSGESPQVREFTPRGRALDRERNLRTGEAYQRIVGEPVYMNVAVPRSFEDVAVTVDYQNNEQSYVEFGLVTSEEPLAVRLAPFDIGVINQAIADGWFIQEKDGVTLLQRDKQFESIEDFVDSVPEDVGVGVYRHQLAYQYIDSSYVPSPEKQVIDRVLRGKHEFWTYAAGETLHVEFDLTDINREFNEDPITVRVYRRDLLVYEQQLDDDGEATGSSEATDRGTVIVDIPNAEAGLYRVLVEVNDDILIRQIRTDQERFVARNNVYLANSAEYDFALPDIDVRPTTLTVQASSIMMQTDHVGGLQVPTIAGEPLHIEQPHRPYWWVSADDQQPIYREIVVPKNDLMFRTNGLIAFSEASFFDADYGVEKITENTSLEQLDYLVYEEYTPPVKERSGFKQVVEMPLDGVAGDRKELKFILSAPGIDRSGGELKIREVRFDFTREPLLERLLTRFR